MPQKGMSHIGPKGFRDNHNTRGEWYEVIDGDPMDAVKRVKIGGKEYISITPVVSRRGGARITQIVEQPKRG